MDQNLKTEEVFESAVSIVRNLPKEGPIKPSDELKLKLYAYFKQATHGPNDTPKPRFYQIVEAYKWDAWKNVGDMSKEDAMLNYINELKQVMDSIPSGETDPEESKRFEDVLGKKFYDYWFNQWQQSGNNKQLVTSALVDNKQESKQEPCGSKSNDTQSNSSSDSASSMSMLEDTQSAGDGYKTPNSLAFKEAFAGEVSDQFALAVLRIQHSLEETINRVNTIESQLKESMVCIRQLENQTHAKQLDSNFRRKSNVCFSSGAFLRILRNIKAIHWFYLSYPILVFAVIRALERKDRNSSR